MLCSTYRLLGDKTSNGGDVMALAVANEVILQGT